ncbi:MAG: glycogen synthase [Anaerolineaceae bacterium]
MYSDPQESVKILFVAAEAAPLIKIGGLGDYIGSLPKALLEATQNHNADISLDIRIAVPYTKMMDTCFLETTNVVSFLSQHGTKNNNFQVYATSFDSITYYILENRDLEEQQDVVYTADPSEDGEKFIAFSLACLDLMQHIGWRADIIHANDWQTGAICSALKKANHTSPHKIKSVFVIHNLPYMGTGAESFIQKYKISGARGKAVPEWGKYLPLVIGIDNADQVITVSPRYAKEILTPQFGNDLQDYLSTKKKKIIGILNGIDDQIWNPETDSFIQKQFNSENMEARKENKIFIQQSLGFQIEPDIPLLVMVSRLDRQKGIRLLCDTLRHFKNEKWQAVILGTGSRDQEELVYAFEKAFPDTVRFLNRFDSSFSHQLPAGGDIFLMPSLYEPCGISQMIAMRYGCIPIAHAVGGLVDSIDENEESRTGFLFHQPERDAFLGALEQAFKQYQKPLEWSKIQKRAMQKDFSWKKSAEEYLKVYRQLLRM